MKEERREPTFEEKVFVNIAIVVLELFIFLIFVYFDYYRMKNNVIEERQEQSIVVPNKNN